MNKLHLGCGSKVIGGWTNVDYSIGAKVSKIPVISFVVKKIGLFRTNWDREIFIHDLREKFPWAENSIDRIYSSHTLEHMTREEGLFFLKECFRVLKAGGVLRVVVPDLKVIVDRYINGDLPAEHFVEQMGVLNVNGRFNRLKKLLLPYISFPHKCMYDNRALIKAFEQVGFAAELREPFVSGIEDVSNIEDRERTVEAVIVEGIKA